MDKFTTAALSFMAQAEQDPVMGELLLRTMCAHVRNGKREMPAKWHPQNTQLFNQGYQLLQRCYPIAVRKLEGVMCECGYKIRDAYEIPNVPVTKLVIPIAYVKEPPPPEKKWWQRIWDTLC